MRQRTAPLCGQPAEPVSGAGLAVATPGVRPKSCYARTPRGVLFRFFFIEFRFGRLRLADKAVAAGMECIFTLQSKHSGRIGQDVMQNCTRSSDFGIFMIHKMYLAFRVAWSPGTACSDCRPRRNVSQDGCGRRSRTRLPERLDCFALEALLAGQLGDGFFVRFFFGSSGGCAGFQEGQGFQRNGNLLGCRAVRE